MSQENTPRNTNRRQQRTIQGTPPTPDETFVLRNTPQSHFRPQAYYPYPNLPYRNPVSPQNCSQFSQPNVFTQFPTQQNAYAFDNLNYPSQTQVGSSSSQ